MSEYIVLQEDSRQQAGKHRNIHFYCQQQGIKIIRSKLLVGDYMLLGSSIPVVNGKPYVVSCDSKMDVAELASCCFQEHDRFRRELIRAQECGIKLIILTEETLPGGRLDNWKSPLDRNGKPKYKFDPVILRKAMITMQEKYGCLFRFCDGRSTGKVLLAYLKGELR